jgi:hypothetical protein
MLDEKLSFQVVSRDQSLIGSSKNNIKRSAHSAGFFSLKGLFLHLVKVLDFGKRLSFSSLIYFQYFEKYRSPGLLQNFISVTLQSPRGPSKKTVCGFHQTICRCLSNIGRKVV